MNRHMTFVFKQCTQHRCSNITSRWRTSTCIPHKPMKRKFHTTIIAKSWPMKFVMSKCAPIVRWRQSKWLWCGAQGVNQKIKSHPKHNWISRENNKCKIYNNSNGQTHKETTFLKTNQLVVLVMKKCWNASKFPRCILELKTIQEDVCGKNLWNEKSNELTIYPL
jgi:hypothetical protein